MKVKDIIKLLEDKLVTSHKRLQHFRESNQPKGLRRAQEKHLVIHNLLDEIKAKI